MRRSLPSSVAGTLAFAAVACGGGAPAGGGAATRDSAGITIVENDAPLWDDGSAWQVAAEPAVTIGVLDGEAEYQLFRASGAFALSDGRIVVANNGTAELRYFTSDGRFHSRAGGRGSGPGEFDWMDVARRTNGDSVMVFELDGSVSLFDERGAFVETIRLELNPKSRPTLVARLAGGEYLVLRDPETSIEEFARASTERPTGVTREVLVAAVHQEDGSIGTTVAEFPGVSIETAVRDIPSKGRYPVQSPVWFAPVLGAAWFGDSFYVGTGDTYDIALHDTGGTVHRIIRRSYDARPVVEADVAQRIELRRAASTEGGPKSSFDNANLEAELSRMAATKTAEHFPPHGSRFLVDTEHSLWVEQFSSERWNSEQIPESGLRYDVFDRSGRYLGAVAFPPGFEPTDIGTDFVLGLWEDEFEVQYVLKYDLFKPASTD